MLKTARVRLMVIPAARKRPSGVPLALVSVKRRINANTMACKIFDIGPATATIPLSRRGFWKLRGFVMTGFPHPIPRPTNDDNTMNMVPMGSR